MVDMSPCQWAAEGIGIGNWMVPDTGMHLLAGMRHGLLRCILLHVSTTVVMRQQGERRLLAAHLHAGLEYMPSPAAQRLR